MAKTRRKPEKGKKSSGNEADGESDYRVLPSFTEFHRVFLYAGKNKDVGTAGAQSILFSNFNLRRKVKEKKTQKGFDGVGKNRDYRVCFT